MDTPSPSSPRVLFDSNGRPGLITILVRVEWERDSSPVLDLNDLRDFWSKSDCPAAAALLDFLEQNPGCVQMGSGAIDINGVTKGAFSPEKALLLQELYMGIPRLNITALEWFVFLQRAFPRVPTELRPHLNNFFAELVQMIHAPRRPVDDNL